eukprot:scaffold315080_cov31-Tisochrysis_lutea.AAC.2
MGGRPGHPFRCLEFPQRQVHSLSHARLPKAAQPISMSSVEAHSFRFITAAHALERSNHIRVRLYSFFDYTHGFRIALRCSCFSQIKKALEPDKEEHNRLLAEKYARLAYNYRCG